MHISHDEMIYIKYGKDETMCIRTSVIEGEPDMFRRGFRLVSDDRDRNTQLLTQLLALEMASHVWSHAGLMHTN